MQSRFTKASRKRIRLRMAIDGPSGSGKTYTALRLAFTLGQRVAVIDTEHGSASKYEGESPDGIPFHFDVVELRTYAPTDYTSIIQEAGREGYDVLVIDSLSHAWIGEGGALDIKDKQGGNSFAAWQKVTPMQRRMVDAILQSPCHVIATMRSKTEWVLEEQINKNGKVVQVPRKIGTAPVQRDGMEYEFDIYGSMDYTHTMTVTKSRCSAVADAIVVKPGPDFLRPVVGWLESGLATPIVISPPPSPPSTPENVAKIMDLLAALKIAVPDALANLKKKYAVDSFEDLTAAQQETIIAAMQARIDQLSATSVVTPAATPDAQAV